MATVKFNQTTTGDERGQDLIARAIDLTGLGHSTFRDLAGLFCAIQELSSKGSTVYRLASIGSYLADDWANLNDCEREALETARTQNAA